ncbi:MAG TPA: hypothetical protein V6C57_10920, partial [Coleofasciculaceae cyanobacterium]
MKRYKGFGALPKYKMTIATYNGGFLTLRFPAKSKDEAIATSNKIAQCISNPETPGKLEALVAAGIPEDEGSALIELGKEMAELTELPPDPNFLNRLAARIATDHSGQKVSISRSRFSDVVGLLKGHH